MTPASFQVPPRGALGTSAKILGSPPSTATVLSFRFAKNPMLRPSGDQKGKANFPAFSVPLIGVSFESRHSQSRLFPSTVDWYTTLRPSGEIAKLYGSSVNGVGILISGNGFLDSASRSLRASAAWTG